MGYHTEFEGRVEVSPPLNAAEVAYLTTFNASRRCYRPDGPYATSEPPYGRQNDQVPGQPYSKWCPWTPTPDGTALVWDGVEKPYKAVAWMTYLIDHFLRDGAAVQQELAAPVPGRTYPPEFGSFTFGHVVNGFIHAEGAARSDVWTLAVVDNQVSRVEGHVEPPQPTADRPSTPGGEPHVGLTRQDWARLLRDVDARKKLLAPVVARVNDAANHLDGEQVTDMVIRALIASGFTITGPDGETQVTSSH